MKSLINEKQKRLINLKGSINSVAFGLKKDS